MCYVRLRPGKLRVYLSIEMVSPQQTARSACMLALHNSEPVQSQCLFNSTLATSSSRGAWIVPQMWTNPDKTRPLWRLPLPCTTVLIA